MRLTSRIRAIERRSGARAESWADATIWRVEGGVATNELTGEAVPVGELDERDHTILVILPDEEANEPVEAA